MTDLPPNSTKLGYAASARRGRRRAWLLVGVLSAVHLAATLLTIFDWGSGWSLDAARRPLMLPLYAAAEYQLLVRVSDRVKLFVLLPLNSVIYGVAFTALLLTVRRPMR